MKHSGVLLLVAPALFEAEKKPEGLPQPVVPMTGGDGDLGGDGRGGGLSGGGGRTGGLGRSGGVGHPAPERV